MEDEARLPPMSPWRYSPSVVTKFVAENIDETDALIIDSDRIVNDGTATIRCDASYEEFMDCVAEVTSQLSLLHPRYDTVAAKFALRRIYQSTPRTFSEYIKEMERAKLLNFSFVRVVKNYALVLDQLVDETRDERLNYFGVKTLEKSYLLAIDGRVRERPQYMYLRVAVALNIFASEKTRYEEIEETYHLLSNGFYIHASPTLYHAGTKQTQLSSCFLKSFDNTTIPGIYTTLGDCAKISSSAGGIGLCLTPVPATGSRTEGQISSGVAPVLRLFDASIALTEQGDNKRPGAMTVYMEPWHPDIFQFLDMRRNRGQTNLKARRLFYALWIPDLYMQRVERDEDWTLINPQTAPDLVTKHGEEFVEAYKRYEANKDISKETIKARELWQAILECQIETGGPFMLYKDAINAKSNQRNLGTITHSNLCTEIMQYSSSSQTAVCNLASLILPAFVVEDEFDFDLFEYVVRAVVRNLNKVTDNTYSSDATAIDANNKQRAIGIGIQGLADTYHLLRMPYDSIEASNLNKKIAQTLYYTALMTSANLAKADSEFYAEYHDSPASEGILQYNMWGVPPPNGFRWQFLRGRILRYGLCNSMLIAMMPTAGTSQITGFSESFEPHISNIYSRRGTTGEYQVILPSLVKDLETLGLWNNDMRIKIMQNEGSIQDIESIPADIKALYKTIWEIGPEAIVNGCVERAPFVCQSQSMSLYVENPSVDRLNYLHFYGWKKGLKTGMYYLRIKPPSSPIPITLPLTTNTDAIIGETFDADDLHQSETENHDESCMACGA